jgi:hypothetical protein
MSENNITVSVEVGEGYESSDRLRVAIAEVGAALHEAHGDDTGGFAAAPYEEISFVFHNITWTVVDGGLTTVVSPRDPASGQATGRRTYEPLKG